jgi:uncharacterized damage-inducible protein DinB
MLVTIEDFAAEWLDESANTERVLSHLTDASLSQNMGTKYRTLGQVAWHLVESLNYIAAMGLSFPGLKESAAIPASARDILDEYRRLSGEMLHAVQTQWTDAELLKDTEIGGEIWTKGASLHFVIMHQAHHRGQMTVLMRQAGLPIPGVYGPTYEGWIEMGREPLV